MPRHSPRPTAGRRPKQRRADGGTASSGPVEMPAGLSQAESEIWKRLAPPAERLGTLTAETVEGFRLLVEVVVQRDRAWDVLDADGLVFEGRAHPVAVHARQLNQRVESLMARFALTAPGRAVDTPRAAESENPWAVFEREHQAREAEFLAAQARRAKRSK